MKAEPIQTGRLYLKPITLETCQAERVDSALLSRLLDAEVPGSWPPPLVTPETIDEFIGMLSDPDSIRLCAWYWIMKPRGNGEKSILIGSGGLFQNDDGSCEIGYSVLDEYQRQGYATEAVQAIVGYIFSQDPIDDVYATTYPELIPSMRVLEKSGFIYDGHGKEEGTIRYCLRR